MVYISTLLLEDTESNKFLNYCRQVWNSQTTTDTLIFRKQSIEQTEFMKLQIFQRPKMLYRPPKLTHCTEMFYICNSKANFNQFFTGHMLYFYSKNSSTKLLKFILHLLLYTWLSEKKVILDNLYLFFILNNYITIPSYTQPQESE